MQYKIRFCGRRAKSERYQCAVEVMVEVEKRFERLVRCAHVLREDDDRQQISREVIRTVSRSTRHGWFELVGLVGSHQQEEACVRSEAVKGVSAGNLDKKRWLKDLKV